MGSKGQSPRPRALPSRPLPFPCWPSLTPSLSASDNLDPSAHLHPLGNSTHLSPTRRKMRMMVPLLWLAGWWLLAAAAASPAGHSSEPGNPEKCPTGNCPHPSKSATLEPSFTETPELRTSTPRKHSTTTHHHRRHTTANHTTSTHRPHPTTTTVSTTTATTFIPTTTMAPENHTTASQPTTASHNHTTSTHRPHPTTTFVPTTTTAPENHTTASQPTTASRNHTTGHPTTGPANRTTSAPPWPTTATPPRPTQPPAVPVGNYSVRQGASVCLRAEMGLQLRIRYGDKAKGQVWGAFVVQPKHTNFSGTCSDKTATLKLQFPEGFILFTFQKNETEKTAYLRQVQANLTYQFPQATEATIFTANNASLREFVAPLGKSYQCRNRSLDLSETFRLTALSERIQAFQLEGGKFGEAEVCPEQQKRSIILPVVVGVVLGLLILIVLVAFAVGRWRGRTGYESL